MDKTIVWVSKWLRLIGLTNPILITALIFTSFAVAVKPAQSQSANSGYVLVRVNCLEIRVLPTDFLEDDVAELQLMVFVSDGDQIAGTFTFFQDSPEAETRGVRTGERFCDGMDASGPWFAVGQAQDDVAVWFLAVDNDDLSQLLDTTLDGTGSLLADAFKAVIDTSGAVSIFSRVNLLAMALELVLGRAIEAWELPDTIGEYQTVLWRQQGWNLGSYTAVSPDGNIVIEYDVLLTNEQPQNAPESPALPTATLGADPVATELDSLFGANNWFCFPDRQNAVGVRYLPAALTVQSPLDHVDTYVGSFEQGETVAVRTGATVWLEGFVALNSCPASQRQALLNWTPDGRGVTREYLDNVFGSQNWECSDQFSFLILVDELPQDFYVEYPFTSVDTSTNLKYGVGDTVPGGSGASVWTLEISRNQCR